MRFLVLGAGALGGLFGGRLLKSGTDITFLVRPKRAAQLKRDGLVIHAHDGAIRTAAPTVQQGGITAPYDVVLLCCKAYDLESAMTAIAPAIAGHTAILPLLNGVRHIDELVGRFGRQHVLGGVTAINAALQPDRTIQQGDLRLDMNILGELDGKPSTRCLAIKSALDGCGIPAEVSGNILAVMWAKFFGYACNATIASVTRSRAGAIARSAQGETFVADVIDECTRVMTAEGFPPPFQTPGFIRDLFSQPGSTYGPSLLFDLEAGRATEGEHTLGDLVGRARRRGIAAPILSAALCSLQTYELGRADGQT